MTRDEAATKAFEQDATMTDEASAIVFAKPSALLTALRSILLQAEQENAGNRPERDLKLRDHQIVMGPQIDEGDGADGYFRFDSGARLSFGITLTSSGSKLLSYRFHYVYPEGHNPRFMRFDLRSEGHADPLFESRAHIHLGNEDVRVPSRCFDPVLLLAHIVYVVSGCDCQVCSESSEALRELRG